MAKAGRKMDTFKTLDQALWVFESAVDIVWHETNA